MHFYFAPSFRPRPGPPLSAWLQGWVGSGGEQCHPKLPRPSSRELLWNHSACAEALHPTVITSPEQCSCCRSLWPLCTWHAVREGPWISSAGKSGVGWKHTKRFSLQRPPTSGRFFDGWILVSEPLVGILVTKHPAGENRQEGSGVQTRGGLNGGVQRPHKSFFRVLEWGKKNKTSFNFDLR